MKSKVGVIVVCAMLLGLVVLYWLFKPVASTVKATAHTRVTPAQATTANAPVLTANSQDAALAAQMLASPLYQGVPLPQGLALDANLNLKPSEGLKQLIDFLLLGDSTADKSITRFVLLKTADEAFANLSAQQRLTVKAQLAQLLTQYLALISYFNQTAAPTELKQKFEWISAKRIAFLGADTARVFYATSEQYDQQLLQDLANGTKRDTPQNFEADIQSFNANQLSVQQRYDARLKLYGKKVADNWLKLDQEEHSFKLQLQQVQSVLAPADTSNKPQVQAAVARFVSADKQAYAVELILQNQLQTEIDSRP